MSTSIESMLEKNTNDGDVPFASDCSISRPIRERLDDDKENSDSEHVIISFNN